MRTWIVETFDPERAKRRPYFSLVFDSLSLRFSQSRVGLRRRAGFTLLELALVLFIIGLLITVLLPRLGDLGGARLETSARRLAALVRYVSGEAAFSGRLYRIRYDLGEQAYGVQILVPSRDTNEFVVDPSPLSQEVFLPSGITFADIRVPSVGRVNSGQVFTHFYPQGYIDPTVIHLRDEQARVMTVQIPPITGEARVYEGYVDVQR
ncbi:MAG: Tfp pilus assembly protein FimT/FimU [Candidatus Binatia bacterium]